MSVDRKVSLDNVGKIIHHELTLPEEGGMVILRGRNGVGKTTVLNTLQTAIDGKGKVNVRDKAEQADVSFLGVNIRARKQTKHSGCLQVESLEGKFSVADVIDPGFTDPVANDRRATLAILQVTGTQADPAAFYDLVGGEERFRSFVSKDTLKEKDMVSLATKVKKDFEGKAQSNEEDVKIWESRAEGLEATLPKEDVVLEKSTHETEADLAAARTKSIQSHTKFEQANAAIKDFEDREKQFLALKSTCNPELKVSQVAEDLSQKSQAQNAASLLAVDLREKLREAETNEKLAIHALEASRKAHEEAVSSSSHFGQLKALVESGRPVEFPEDAVERADQEVTRLQNLLMQSQATEGHAEVKKEAEELRKKAASAASQASALRDAAQSVNSVLTDMISKVCPELRFENDRLKVDTERGATFFNDTEGTNGLSKGQRTKLAIDIAARAVGEGGVIVLPQDFTQDLDPIARQEVADHARLRSVTIITAMCTADDELNSETL